LVELIASTERLTAQTQSVLHRFPSSYIGYNIATFAKRFTCLATNWRWRRNIAVFQMVLTCCTISSTLILHLHPTILHNVQTQTTAVSLLQLVNGEYLAVPSHSVLCVSQYCQVY